MKAKKKVRQWALLQVDDLDTVRYWIHTCEGGHIQQVAYSTFHEALTQVCFTCCRVRTNLTPIKPSKRKPLNKEKD